MKTKNADVERSMVASNIFFEPLIFKEYPYRLLILFLYYSLYAISQIALTVYSAAFTMIATHWKWPMLYSYICPIMWLIFSIPTMQIIKQVNNNKIIIRVACVIVSIGAAAKIAGDLSPVFIILGQIFSAFGISLIARSNAKIVYNWWAFSKREILIQVHDTAAPIGYSIGFIIPGYFELDHWPVKSYIITEAAIVSAFALLTFLFFKDKPRTPPSKLSEFEVPDIIPSLKSYFSDRNFILIFLCYSLIFGASITLMIFFPLLISQFGFSPAPLNVSIGTFLLFGLIVAFLLAMIKGKYKDPLILTLIQMSVFIGSTIITAAGLAEPSRWLLYCGTGLSICFLIPIPGFLYSVLTSYVHDFHEALVSATFTTGGSAISLIFGGVLSVLIDDPTKAFYGFLMVPGSILLCMICLMLLKS